MKQDLTLMCLVSDADRLCRFTTSNAFLFEMLINLQVELRDDHLSASALTQANINSLATAICNVMLLNEDDVMAYINAKFIVAGKEPFFVNIKCKWCVQAGYTRGVSKTQEYCAHFMEYSRAITAYDMCNRYTWRTLKFLGAY